MTAKDCLKNAMEFSRNLAVQYLNDLTDADLLVRPVPNANHIAWQIGHLISGERQMVAALGQPMPELPSGFVEFYGSKDAPKSDDPKKFLTKKEYIDLWGRVRSGTLAALSITTETDLTKPGPEPMRAVTPTVASVFSLIGMHPLMHTGQWTVVRRKLNKPVLF